MLEELGVTHIVCLSAEGCCRFREWTAYLEHLLIELECKLDMWADQIANVVPSCVDFIRKALPQSSTRVLIQCLYGRTRSAVETSCVRAVLLRETFEIVYEKMAA